MTKRPNLPRIFESAVWILVAAGVVAAGIRLARQQKLTAPRAQFLETIDQFYRTKCPEGNLFIHFEDLNEARDGEFIFVQFVRASYTLHPRKVYVAAPPHIHLPDSKAILEHNDLPTDAWLRSHGIKYVLTFTAVDGRPAARVRRVEDEE